MARFTGGLAALLLALAASFAPAPVRAAQAHIEAWNQNCAAYHFAAYPQSAQTTFGSAYSGSNFSADLAALQGIVCLMPTQPWEHDDLLNATLINQ